VAIPQLDLRLAVARYRDEIDRAIASVLDRGWFVLGPEVEAFEEEFARYLGVRHCVGVASGTDALHLALRASGVGPGDLVFTVSHTAVATVAAIELTGAVPVFVDIESATYTIDPQALLRGIEWAGKHLAARPAAVVVVHLYGHPAAMPAVLDLAARHGLVIVEDCAQSHGATIEGRMTGSWGTASAFSFYPTKNLGALGDGGAVATDDSGVAARVRLLRQYGWRVRSVSDTPGFNSRLDEVQAAVLRIRLRHLDVDNGQRRAIAARYAEVLASRGLELPIERTGYRHVYHQYVVATDTRHEVRSVLAEAGIETAIHYPMAVHQQPAYCDRPQATSLGATETAVGQVLSLPMQPELDFASVDEIGTAVSRA